MVSYHMSAPVTETERKAIRWACVYILTLPRRRLAAGLVLLACCTELEDSGAAAIGTGAKVFAVTEA